MSDGKGKILHAKLFLEGIEVPFIGATITHTVNQTAICYVDVTPTKAIMQIKPRTHVMVSVRDFGNEANGFPYVKAWEGEVFGYGFNKDPQSRGFSLHCMDVSGYWDNVLLYYFNAQQSLGKGADIAPLGQDVLDAQKAGVSVQATTHSSSSYFIQIMKETLQNSANDFLDGLVAIYKKMQNVNRFYNNAETRLRISDRIRLRSSGKIEELLKANEGLEWISGVVGQNSGYSTLRQTVQKLMGLIFHDFVSIPFPAKVTVEDGELTGEPIATNSKEKATQG